MLAGRNSDIKSSQSAGAYIISDMGHDIRGFKYPSIRPPT